MKNPEDKCIYTCKILDGGFGPQVGIKRRVLTKFRGYFVKFQTLGIAFLDLSKLVLAPAFEVLMTFTRQLNFHSGLLPLITSEPFAN